LSISSGRGHRGSDGLLAKEPGGAIVLSGGAGKAATAAGGGGMRRDRLRARARLWPRSRALRDARGQQ
jgi:hypothetical protein